MTYRRAPNGKRRVSTRPSAHNNEEKSDVYIRAFQRKKEGRFVIYHAGTFKRAGGEGWTTFEFAKVYSSKGRAVCAHKHSGLGVVLERKDSEYETKKGVMK